MAAPHTSQATGPYPTATVEGINNTFLAPHSDGNLLFRPDPAQYDPAVQTDFFHNNAERLRADKTLEYEVLTKSYDQFTTRSNVFGVWITVGLFRVTDATTQPVRLGAEYVSPNVQRKRFFCVVDRTNLSIRNDAPTEQGAKPVFFPFLSADGNSPGFIEGNVNVTMIVPAAGRDPNDNNTLIGNCEGVPWSIGVGTRLWLDVGSLQEGNDDYLNRQEPVTVSAVNFDAGSRRATISFAITKGHAQGCAVSTALPGNPGPQPRFDYRAETYRQTVVPVSGFLN
jgi:hypothetical protein